MHTIAHMKECLKKMGVKGYSGCSKAELMKMCKDHGCMDDVMKHSEHKPKHHKKKTMK